MVAFRNSLAETVFYTKYARAQDDTWANLSRRLVDDVCGPTARYPALMAKEDRAQLVEYITKMYFIPGGRYLAYAGRPLRAYNNCYLLRAEEDSREEWAAIMQRVTSCLMMGGGIGVDYSILRAKGSLLKRTGGVASGPIPLMTAVNELGRNVMQGGSRRSAIYASLNWQHDDVDEFLTVKNWSPAVAKAKEEDFNSWAKLDMTNISLNYDDRWLNSADRHLDPTFLKNVRQALSTGEPGFSFNFGSKQNETLRNAPLGGDTYVYTSRGYKQIKEIVDRPIRIWTGKQWARTQFKKTATNAPTLRVKMSGGREIIAEPTHEFFLKDGSKKSARDLRLQDSLQISLPTDCSPFGLDRQGYTLGYVYGDGSFHAKYPRAEVTFCTPESKECLENFDPSLLTSVTQVDSRGYTRAYTKNDVLFSNRIKEQFPDELLGMGDTEFLCSFIAGLFDSDGNYFEAQNRVRVASKHKPFLEGVRRALEQLGILSGISTAGVSTYGKSVGYLLSIYGSYINRFAKIIPTKRLKIKDHTPYRVSQIKVLSVEFAENQDVFCCDVGVEEHAFMAEGIIVANCTEVTSEDDSDVCNLGSVNMATVPDIATFSDVVDLASKFLVCGTVRADLPYAKVYEVRQKNRRLGLGLMGMHEWLLKRKMPYSITQEMRDWLFVYEFVSTKAANQHCDRLFMSRPVGYRAIAPTGTIGILAGTTTGIEPLYAVSYKRRYLKNGSQWHYQYVVDSTAQYLINTLGIDPSTIETAASLAAKPKARLEFQAVVQQYVDHAISSTINLPSWGSDLNNEDKVLSFAELLSGYSPGLRGFTCYPDGSRGGQPITEVPYSEAVGQQGVEYREHDVCDITGKGGTCGT